MMRATRAERLGETSTCRVVVNHEQRYSIWQYDRTNPPGWTDEGTAGSKEDCLRRVEDIWTDMRPLHVRGAHVRAGVHRAVTETNSAAHRTTPIPLLLERMAAMAPTAVAVEDATRTLTYKQLAERVNHLANRLVDAKVGVQYRVGVMMRHTCDLLVAIMAILRAGATYVPIDPDYPDERKKLLATRTGIVALISDRESGDRLPAVAVPTIEPDEGSSVHCVRSHQVVPDDLACIIHTSGSTGVPKGVMITHRGLSNLAFSVDEEFDIQPSDRYLMFASASFSASLEEMFPPLIHGATSVFPTDRAALLPVHALLDFIEAHAISLLGMQPAQWHLLVSQVGQDQRTLPPSLRRVSVSGDRVLPQAVAEWTRRGVPLLHVYGQTEATATATYWIAWPGQISEDGVVPLGQAITGMRLFVVDEQLEQVKVGTPGELLLGGESLARGYLDQPAATAEKFVPDPFSGIEGAVLYRTGDLVRELPDGRLQFLGRIDQQVKVCGYRVEPTEVEAALCRHPEVRQALVLSRTDSAGQHRLVGYVTADAGTVTAAKLRRFLADSLPSYLIPSAFLRLDEFPLTVNRKVDRAALPAPRPERPNLGNEFVPPADALEREMCALAAELLQLDDVGALDDFLDLGGDSLFVISMIGRVASRYGVDIGFREALERRTVRALASQVRHASL